MINIKKSLMVLFVTLNVMFMSTSVIATDVLFYDGFSDLHPLDTGWEGEYAGTPVSMDLYDDIYPEDFFTLPHEGYFMTTKDDAAAVVSIDTTGYENIHLSYFRRSLFVPPSAIQIVEWRVGDTGAWNEIESTHPTTDDWLVNHFDFPTSADDESEIQIRFWLDGGEDADYALWDSIEVTGDMIVDSDAPSCSVDYLGNDAGDVLFDLTSSTFLSDSGDFVVYGSAWDDASLVDRVQYSRDSPGSSDDHGLTDADAVDDDFDSLSEEWKSTPFEGDYDAGEHQICCRASDSSNNGGEVVCTDFCVDESEPEEVTKPVHDNPSECVPEYVGDNPVFRWDEAIDNGCAGIDYYHVSVYDSNDVLLYEVMVEDTHFEIESPVEGEGYYITVFAVDMAGNEGPVSLASTIAWYDSLNPNVEIVAPLDDGWYNMDLEVMETSDDNTGIHSCEYKVMNGDVMTVDWTEFECGETVDVTLIDDCPVDGVDQCDVWVRVMDVACNEASDHVAYDVDDAAPVTTKTISDPKYPGFEWLGWAVDWFVTDETEISFTCDDAGLSGCADTFYRISFDDGEFSEWMTYVEPFSVGEDDGIYELEYYSTDNIGNVEETQYEIDKLDNIAPETQKTVGEPQYTDESGNLWVSGMTDFLFECEDSQVGCDYTRYRITPDYGNAYDALSVDTTDTIFDVASSDEDFETLVVALELTGLDTVLDSPGSFTVFAPTDAAFDALPPGTLDALVADPEALTEILLYHVVGQGLLASDVLSNDMLRTLQGSEAELSIVGSDAFIDGAMIVVTDIVTSNGVIHVIDAVILPSPGSEEASWNMLDGDVFYFGDDYSDGRYLLDYSSVDYLGNVEATQTQEDWLDNTAPEVELVYPVGGDEIAACTQSVVAIVTEYEGSGISHVWAELTNSEDEVVRTVDMEPVLYGTYEAQMDKALPAGDYVLTVYAEDNVGNMEVVSAEEVLLEGVFVEYVSPAQCQLDPETGGACDFTFNVCMRGGDSVRMWMDPLAGVVTPGLMDATISKGDMSTYVGLNNPLTPDAGLLDLQEGIINGRTNFDLQLTLDANLTSQIGEGAHDISYIISAFVADEDTPEDE